MIEPLPVRLKLVVHQERLRGPALRRRSNRPRSLDRGAVLTPGPMEVMPVSTRFELERDREWFKQILANGPRGELPLAGGKVCQGCGKLGFYEGAEEHSAAHWECGGDFLAFDTGHEACSQVPYSSDTRHRGWRYCEVCRVRVQADSFARCGHFWLCVPCEARIVEAEQLPGEVLGDLAQRRKEIRGLLALERREEPGERPAPDPNLIRAKPVPPLPGGLPLGLETCGGCGQIRGIAPRPIGDGIKPVKSTCFCEGLVCRRCGRRRARRPISEYFSVLDGHWWHVPAFASMLQLCQPCNRARNEEFRQSSRE